jgi:hypothetical protein
MNVWFNEENGAPRFFAPEGSGMANWKLYPTSDDHGEMLTRLPDRRWVLWRSVAPDRVGLDRLEPGRIVTNADAARMLLPWGHELPVDLRNQFAVPAESKESFDDEVWVDVSVPEEDLIVPMRVDGAEKWTARWNERNWDSFEDFFQNWDDETLYRLADRTFILETHERHFAVGWSCSQEAKRLSEADAVEWFLSRRVVPPIDLRDAVAELRSRPRSMLAEMEAERQRVERELELSEAISDPRDTDEIGPERDGSETGREPPAEHNPGEGTATMGRAEIKPRWDGEARILYYGDEVARTFQKKAESCVKILTSFEEDGWERRTDSLFTETEIRHGKHHDALRSLNSGLRFIRFRSDGTGEGFIWEPIAPEE